LNNRFLLLLLMLTLSFRPLTSAAGDFFFFIKT
jgi:hypothetical protein